MERINVSKAFRVCKTNCGFKMSFNSAVDMRKAYEAMESAVMSIVDENGYYALWLQDLGDCCTADNFDFNSTLGWEEFMTYVPVMLKAVAETLPSAEFEASAWYDDLRCYCVDEFEASFKDHLLTITETFADDDHGYFCPTADFRLLLLTRSLKVMRLPVMIAMKSSRSLTWCSFPRKSQRLNTELAKCKKNDRFRWKL